MEDFLNAARAGDIGKLRSLLAADPSVLNVRDAKGQSALMLAKYYRQAAAVEFLLSLHPTVTLYEACAVGDLARVREAVRSGGVRAIDSHAEDGFTPLALACFFGQVEVARLLINSGANINLAAANVMKVAPIHAAVAARATEIVRMLVENGADVNVRQQQGWTPLHAAAQNGDREIAKMLLDKGADRNARADNNQTAVDLAMVRGDAETVALLEGE
ncbi:MAG: ankyrin repeat domain-containing protein [Bryobacteraceae bacterium]